VRHTIITTFGTQLGGEHAVSYSLLAGRSEGPGPGTDAGGLAHRGRTRLHGGGIFL